MEKVYSANRSEIMLKIVHLTSIHPHDDIRIFLKMCRSLASVGHDVHLVAPRSDTSEVELCGSVTIHPVIPSCNRFERMTATVKEVLRIACTLEGDMYHFHDPDFLRYAPEFQKKIDRPFVYDAHEDYRLGILDKEWIPKFIRLPVAWRFGRIEDRESRCLAGVIAATPAIAERFEGHPGLATIQNFPLRHELSSNTHDVSTIKKHFVYTGVVSEQRGAREMSEAVSLLGEQINLAVAGRFASDSLQTECINLAGNHLKNCGFLDRPALRDLFAESLAGLVLFHPLGNHVRAQPNKLFEYMSAGLPVIASDFPLWRSIVDEAGCGLLVDPLDPHCIAKAMQWIIEHPIEAAEMGNRGRVAVLEKYNWETEFPKLLAFYEKINYTMKRTSCASG